MSATTEQSLKDPATTAGSAPGSDRVDAQQPAPGAGAGAGPSKAGDGKVPEKTISCVSCRKRKLKCDRTKPKCGTCIRLRHDCEYPERRRNLGSKRRNMKELEARLAQVETQLVSEQKLAGTQGPTVAGDAMTMEADWNTLGMDMNLDIDDADLLDPSFQIPQFGMESSGPLPMQSGDYFTQSQDLLALGLQEPLPPQEMMDELYEIYFERFHRTLPMMHKLRFYASLDQSPNKRPPICLRYAMWAMAASMSEKYQSIEDIMYERARKYVDAEEMKGRGEVFVTIYHAQTWVIIANYEAKKTYFSRSWMSTGRMVRMVHMLGLYRLDTGRPGVKTILQPARDWIELEERRRTFWAAFYGDRWASSGTGWPMIIDEREIQTNLPASEYSFENGIEESTVPLSEALTPEGAPKVSDFGGVIISATLFGHNFEHLHHSGPNENPHDLQNGDFWKRHRKMDNVLSNTFMFLPDHLRLPSGARNMNVVFIHMNIHASAICLHQAAVLTAQKHNLDPNFILKSHARCLMAAEEITNIMRLVSHVDASTMHSWIGFCLYVASGIFIKDQKMKHPSQTSLSNLEFLLAAMRAIGTKHSVTKHFTAQLELDVDASLSYGLGKDLFNDLIPNIPINGVIADQQVVPVTYDDIQGFVKSNSLINVNRNCPSRQGSSSNSNIALTPLSGVMPDSSNNSSGESPDQVAAYWDTMTIGNYVPRSQADPERHGSTEPSDQTSQSNVFDENTIIDNSKAFINNEIGQKIADNNNDLSSAQNSADCHSKAHAFHNPAEIRPFIEGTNIAHRTNAQPSTNQTAVSLPMQFLVGQNARRKAEPLPTTDGIFTLHDGPVPSFPTPAGPWSSLSTYEETAAHPQTIEEELQDFISKNFRVDESWGTNQPRG